MRCPICFHLRITHFIKNSTELRLKSYRRDKEKKMSHMFYLRGIQAKKAILYTHVYTYTHTTETHTHMCVCVCVVWCGVCVCKCTKKNTHTMHHCVKTEKNTHDASSFQKKKTHLTHHKVNGRCHMHVEKKGGETENKKQKTHMTDH